MVTIVERLKGCRRVLTTHGVGAIGVYGVSRRHRENLRGVSVLRSMMKSAMVMVGLFFSAAYSQQPTREECESDNENVSCCFVDMPVRLSHRMHIAGENEPGSRMVIRGIVKRSDGKTPYPNVLLYGYHTNKDGVYPKRGNERGIRKWHGYLHGWLRTDSAGMFEIHSIRPEPYPSGNAPAHIHLVIREPNGETYYVNDILFADDPLLRQSQHQPAASERDGGVVALKKNNRGVWEGFRTIVTR